MIALNQEDYMTHTWNYKAKQAANFIQTKLKPLNFNPKVFMVLGSGFRDAVNEWPTLLTIPISAIPSYPQPSVQGHGANLIASRLETSHAKIDVLIATGRTHLYEGRTAFEVCLPIFMAYELGIQNIILTNAAGGLSPHTPTGSVIVISDHLNLTGQNVAASTYPPQFIAMDGAYDKIWRDKVCSDIDLKSGIYAAVLGPSFETAAEARMLKLLGADLAGMSTVQETIAARMNGQKVFACSFVTNTAGDSSSDHNDVLKAVEDSMPIIQKTLITAIEHIPRDDS
jgi:purine-nucleoside phosphorylase